MKTLASFTALFLLLSAHAGEKAQISPAAETQRAVIHDIVSQNIAEGLFSAAQIAVFEKGTVTFSYHAGRTNLDSGDPITPHTLFDLASLTKPLGTLLMCGYLFTQKKLDSEERISEILPEITKPIRIGDLLAHTSGLPGYDGWFLKYRDLPTIADRKAAIVQYAAEFPKVLPPKYSDLNYLLLGFILEQVSGRSLDDLYAETLTAVGYRGLPPLFITNGIDLSLVVATSHSPVNGTLNHGRVEDENCQLIGGVCGHAGLFGTAEGIGALLSHLLTIPWYRAFVTEGIGFDRPEPPDSSYGLTATPDMRGHLGYTGTAFLIDLKRDRVIVVLANRTHPTPDKPKMKERLKKFRQAIFDELLK